VSTTVHYRGRERFTFEDCEYYSTLPRERFTLKECEYYSTLHREREVHTQGLLVPQYTTEGEKGSHSRAVGTTVHYRGRERFTLKGCWYNSTLQRERKVHTQCLLVPQYNTEEEKGSHSRAVGTTIHYRGRERYTLEDCEYHSTLQRERKVHTQGL
jgi:hypothetical protein